MMQLLLRVPQWPGSDGLSGVRTSFITGQNGVRQRLSFCAFVQIRVQQPQFGVLTHIGFTDIRNMERVTALPEILCFKEQS
jgi:hypothetical protein